ncbi:hypothetical protein [Symmachiella dynata]|uniref:hypothetical protein n=1 Tax=Symmachiella dynata TaxID=2527995 RepID=UPI0030EC0334
MMIDLRGRAQMSRWCLAAVVGFLIPTACYALAGSRQVAKPGRPVRAQSHWPDGVDQFLNDPARTGGWSDFFNDWPSDVCNYVFQVKNTDELNKLLIKFGKIKSFDLEVKLAPAKEPGSLGWVTKLPPGNGAAALFSIGNQKQVAQWYDRLETDIRPGESELKFDKRSGKIRFLAMPEAVPPTLTIYVDNPVVDLKKLRIPKRITVSAGHAVPPLFKSWNRVEKPDSRLPVKNPDVAHTLKAIAEFIARRDEAVKQDSSQPDPQSTD